MLVDKALALGTLVQRRAQVRGPHPLTPPERLEEEEGTCRVPIVDGEDKEDGGGCPSFRLSLFHRMREQMSTC
jgi:hypothetical protein